VIKHRSNLAVPISSTLAYNHTQEIISRHYTQDISSIISNLFVHLLEESVTEKLKKTGDILSWVRFADDICCIIKKGSLAKVYKKINTWAGNLKFTYENMSENRLIFLDCELYLSQTTTIEFKNYRKNDENTIFKATENLSCQKDTLSQIYLVNFIESLTRAQRK
jgi:hypothetical protein